MKKIVLVLSIISVLFLVGCNENEDVVINYDDNLQENVGNYSQQIENDDKDNENNSIIQTDEQKYKLSNSYYISGEGLSGECLIDLSYTAKKYEEHSYIESDGNEFDITCELSEIGTDGMRSTYDVRINGETINLPLGDTFGCSVVMDRMVVIDLDENDQYKELLLTTSEGLLSSEYIYRLTRNGLELIFTSDSQWDYFVKIGDKVIYTNNKFRTEEGVITKGYYLYEDGEFKYIDRFATGENVTDENGMFPESFQKLEFYAAGGESIVLGYKDGDVVGTFNLISYEEKYEQESDFHYPKYDVRLTKDCEYHVSHFDSNHNYTHTTTEILPAGTILEDIGIDFFK